MSFFQPEELCPFQLAFVGVKVLSNFEINPLAVSLLFLSSAAEAVDLLEEIVAEHPDYMGARFMLAAAYGCLGDLHRSVKAFETLKKTQTVEVLKVAIVEIEERLKRSGLMTSADHMKTLVNSIKP